MKTVENKKLEIPGDIKDYFDLIKICMNQPPQGGYNADEMRKRLRVLNVIDKEKESMELEDADVACTQQCVKEMRWNFLHQDILNFVEYISGL